MFIEGPSTPDADVVVGEKLVIVTEAGSGKIAKPLPTYQEGDTLSVGPMEEAAYREQGWIV